MTPYEIIREVREHGWLLLMANGRLHVELHAGQESLLAELKAQKERVRAILGARRDAKHKRKVQRPAVPLPSSTRYSRFVPIACNCRKHSYPHVHERRINLNDPDDVIVVTLLSGDAVWGHLKKQVAIAHEKAKNPVFDNYAFELTQAVPPIVLRSEDAHCDRPMESIKPGESIEIMIGREMTPPKGSELSPWGKPKIKGYTKYRWNTIPKGNDADSSCYSLLACMSLRLKTARYKGGLNGAPARPTTSMSAADGCSFRSTRRDYSDDRRE